MAKDKFLENKYKGHETELAASTEAMREYAKIKNSKDKIWENSKFAGDVLLSIGLIVGMGLYGMVNYGSAAGADVPSWDVSLKFALWPLVPGVVIRAGGIISNHLHNIIAAPYKNKMSVYNEYQKDSTKRLVIQRDASRNLQTKFNIKEGEKFGGIEADNRATRKISEKYIVATKELMNKLINPKVDKKEYGKAIVQLKEMFKDEINADIESEILSGIEKYKNKLSKTKQAEIVKIFKSISR